MCQVLNNTIVNALLRYVQVHQSLIYKKQGFMEILMRKLRVAITPREWLLKTTLSDGIVIYGKNRAGFGGRGIYIYRDSIEPEFQHLEEFLDSNSVFVDVGANVGIYTLKAAKYLDKGGIVLALEPFPDILSTLYHNIQANRFTNVRLRNFCAGKDTGHSMLWMNSNKPNSFSLVKIDKEASSLSTLTVSLDELFGWEGLERLDYLKIDAEGAEQQILVGATKILEKHRPIIQLEVTINEVLPFLIEYSIFQAPGSPNKIYIPNESTKIHLPKKLGWEQIQ
jgi:FkbM family methyltransferase